MLIELKTFREHDDDCYQSDDDDEDDAPVGNGGYGGTASRVYGSAYDLVDPPPAACFTNCLPLVPYAGKRLPLKTFSEVQTLLQQGRKRDVKLLIRENSWPINSSMRSQLWPLLCRQHQHSRSMLDGFYWDMVNQVRFHSIH